MVAGADFIKTSTGKIGTAATPPFALVMVEAIREFSDQTGRVGIKPAGGIRTAKQALHNLVIVAETLGADWLTPDLFRSAPPPSSTTCSCRSKRNGPAPTRR